MGVFSSTLRAESAGPLLRAHESFLSLAMVRTLFSSLPPKNVAFPNGRPLRLDIALERVDFRLRFLEAQRGFSLGEELLDVSLKNLIYFMALDILLSEDRH